MNERKSDPRPGDLVTFKTIKDEFEGRVKTVAPHRITIIDVRSRTKPNPEEVTLSQMKLSQVSFITPS